MCFERARWTSWENRRGRMGPGEWESHHHHHSHNQLAWFPWPLSNFVIFFVEMRNCFALKRRLRCTGNVGWEWSCAMVGKNVFRNSALRSEAGSLLCWRLRLNIKLICKLPAGCLCVPIKKTVSPVVTPLQLWEGKLQSFSSLVKFHHHQSCTQVLLCWGGNKTRSCIWLNLFSSTTRQLTSSVFRYCCFDFSPFCFQRRKWVPTNKSSADWLAD